MVLGMCVVAWVSDPSDLFKASHSAIPPEQQASTKYPDSIFCWTLELCLHKHTSVATCPIPEPIGFAFWQAVVNLLSSLMKWSVEYVGDETKCSSVLRLEQEQIYSALCITHVYRLMTLARSMD